MEMIDYHVITVFTSIQKVRGESQGFFFVQSHYAHNLYI